MPELPVDTDHDLVEHLFTLHSPSSAEMGELMSRLRARYMVLAHEIVDEIPRTSDRTLALRSLHRACMDTIFAVAGNQELFDR